MITASIVTYCHTQNELQQLISVALNCVEKLYVVDNSPEDTLRTIGEISPKIKYIRNKNTGYGSAHNIAIREAISLNAVYHVVLNPDIVFKPEVIESLIQYMDQHQDVGQIMPKVFYPDGRLQYLCKMVPTPFDLIFKRFLPEKLTRKRMDKFQLRFTGYDSIMNVPYLSGCFMLFRVSALKEIGLFDERFFMYPEDIDITRRMHRQYKTIFYPHVSIIHAHAAASKTNVKMLKIHILNMIKYFNKWGWFFDSERRNMNKQLLKEFKYEK